MNIKYVVGAVALGVIVAAGVMYLPKQQKDDPAKQLGHQLYRFGVAAAAFAQANPTHYTPDDERLVVYGIEWLQPEFLPEDFDFNTADFKIADVEPGKGPVKTVLNANETGLGDYIIEVELIELGEVLIDGKPDVQAALQAANYANNDQTNGKAPDIFYTLDMGKDEQGVEVGHLVGKSSKNEVDMRNQGNTEFILEE